ncbi:hypothetical protein BDN67DRAFT_1017811 [Paxillus ammoniavirescens]|nr:hypothetical protein BDN67DRAFT_1017811 [Paxillus ammoniavirescens]
MSVLCSRVSHEDQRLLEDVTNATMAWNTLHERHKKQPPSSTVVAPPQRPAPSVVSKATPLKAIGSQVVEWQDTEEVLAKICVDKAACGKGGTRPPAPSTPSTTPNTPSPGSGVRFDSHGYVYILDSMTGRVVSLATASPVAPLQPLRATTVEFTGLAHDSSVFLQNLSGGNQYEFDALLAHLRDLTTSVDWRRHSFPPTAHLSVAVPNQCTSTTINPNNKPFFIDTSAPVHISNTTITTRPHPYPGSPGAPLLVSQVLEPACSSSTLPISLCPAGK